MAKDQAKQARGHRLPRRHWEQHRVEYVTWLRAAVLGANDGIVSTASLVLGVASANASHASIMLAGIAGLAAGAMSMAAGEYVSVHSQADSENADLEREREELRTDSKGELNELAGIYEKRGLDPALARTVAEQLTARDALAAHARDELGLSATRTTSPVQAAFASASSFAVGAALPLVVAVIVPQNALILAVSFGSLACLAMLGAIAARAGGANVRVGALRVTFWGAIAMAVTAGVGHLFGVAV